MYICIYIYIYIFRFEPKYILKYSCFSRSALLLTVLEKCHTKKSCISSEIKGI